MRSFALLALLAACGHRAGAPPPAPAALPASPDARAAPSFVVVDGEWTRDWLGGPRTSPLALRADDSGVTMLIDAGPTLMTRATGATWVPRALDADSVVAGELEGDAMLLVRFDTTTMKSELVYLRDGVAEVVASGCDNVVYKWVDLIAPDVITYECHDDRVVARRTAAGWETVATPPAMLMTGAVGDDGTIYLLDATLMQPMDWFVIRDGRITASTVPDVDAVGTVAACGGDVYATFEQDGGTAFGRLDGATWRLESVQTDVASAGVLAFDEACHPFVAAADRVYARAETGWVASSVGASVKDLAAHDGHLYATYDEITDSVHAGFAEATLRRDR